MIHRYVELVSGFPIAFRGGHWVWVSTLALTLPLAEAWAQACGKEQDLFDKEQAPLIRSIAESIGSAPISSNELVPGVRAGRFRLNDWIGRDHEIQAKPSDGKVIVDSGFQLDVIPESSDFLIRSVIVSDSAYAVRGWGIRVGSTLDELKSSAKREGVSLLKDKVAHSERDRYSAAGVHFWIGKKSGTVERIEILPFASE